MGSPTLKDEHTRQVLKQNVRRILAALDMSENQLANKADISQKHVNNVANARSGCGIDALASMAEVFGIPTWLLLTPGAGAAFEDARRIIKVTETVVQGPPPVRDAIFQTVKKLIA